MIEAGLRKMKHKFCLPENMMNNDACDLVYDDRF